MKRVLLLFTVFFLACVTLAQQSYYTGPPVTVPAFTTPTAASTPGSPLTAHMVLVSGGTFDMGDVRGDAEQDDERVHRVKISDFLLGRCEVTFDEYDAFCDSTGRAKPGDHNWGRGRRPAINVDWYDAIEYCNWLSSREGLTAAYQVDISTIDPNNNYNSDTKKWSVTRVAGANGYRLPTEAEWEYAAREGGKKLRFGDGRDLLDPARVNFNAHERHKKSYSIVGEYRVQTVPVDELAANSLGLRHMSGNVWEWCWDWYASGYYVRSPSDNPGGATSGKFRVCRGGAWVINPPYCRAADRYWSRPDNRDATIGFRLARDY